MRLWRALGENLTVNAIDEQGVHMAGELRFFDPVDVDVRVHRAYALPNSAYTFASRTKKKLNFDVNLSH